MRIGIKTITGIGIAAILSLGTAIPAHADGNNSGDSFANATNNTVTTTLTNDQVQFRYTAIRADSVEFAWNPTIMEMDANAWCEIMLWEKNSRFDGYNAYGTQDANVGTFRLGAGGNGVGSLIPGGTFRVQLLCHNGNATQDRSYTADWFTAVNPVVAAPAKPVVTSPAKPAPAVKAPAKKAVKVSKKPSTVKPSFRVHGTKVTTRWNAAKTNKGGAIKQYRVVVSKGKKTYYSHTFKSATRSFTKSLPRGTYTVKITATNKAGSTTTNVKLRR